MILNRQEAFDAWAPPGGLWTPWVKPVLFAHLPVPRAAPPVPATAAPLPPPGAVAFDVTGGVFDPSASTSAPTAAATPVTVAVPVTPPEEPLLSLGDVGWVPNAAAKTPIVVDLPGAQAVRAGVELARRGYRPVPLFNAAPGPAPGQLATAAVDVAAIGRALWELGDDLMLIKLAPDAPPAFLLDASRRGTGQPPAEGMFDNRSVSFPTDFPSANLLRSRGVAGAMLIIGAVAEPQPDLQHTLRRWQEGGMRITLARMSDVLRPQPWDVPRPSRFRSFLYQLVALAGLKRHYLGGFGGEIVAANYSSG